MIAEIFSWSATGVPDIDFHIAILSTLYAQGRLCDNLFCFAKVSYLKLYFYMIVNIRLTMNPPTLAGGRTGGRSAAPLPFFLYAAALYCFAINHSFSFFRFWY